MVVSFNVHLVTQNLLLVGQMLLLEMPVSTIVDLHVLSGLEPAEVQGLVPDDPLLQLLLVVEGQGVTVIGLLMGTRQLLTHLWVVLSDALTVSAHHV